MVNVKLVEMGAGAWACSSIAPLVPDCARKLAVHIPNKDRAITQVREVQAVFMAFSLSRRRRILKVCLSLKTLQLSPRE
jgi:hypothetical protein